MAPRDHVTALCLAAWLTSGDVGQARADAEHARSIARAAGDDGLEATSRAALAFVLLQQARPEDALDVLDGCPDVEQRLGRRWDEGAARILTVHAALTTGDTVLAGSACRAAEAVVPALGDDWALGHLHAAQGFLAQVERRFSDAATHLRSAAEAAERLGFRATESLHLCTLGRILQQAGDPARRRRRPAARRRARLRPAGPACRVAGTDPPRAGAARRRRPRRRSAVLQAADRWFSSSGGGEGAGLAASLRAATDAEDGDPDGVRPVAGVLADAERRGNPELQVLALDALARSAAAERQLEQARDLLARADRLLPSAQHLVDDADRLDAHAARQVLLRATTTS